MPNSSQHSLTMISPILRFIKILLNFNESNIHSRHNKNTMSSIIQKKREILAVTTQLEKKDKHNYRGYVLNYLPHIIFDKFAIK